MDVTHPIATVIPSAHGPVLAVLARASEALTGRTVAALTDPPVSPSQTATILTQLATSGLVTTMRAGTAVLYSLNREHLAAPAVEHLATLREKLWDRIVEQVNTWAHRPDALVVFGSMARGDGSSESDIDILLIRPADVPVSDGRWHNDLTVFASKITTWTGNSVDLLDYTRADLMAMAVAREALLDNIRDDGRFLIGGRSMLSAPPEA
jgi:predicted nucleotidyltransferase